MTATAIRTTKKPVQHLEALAAKLADARYERKRWEEEEARIAALLIEAHTAGVAPTKFKAAGWSFTFQEGRKTIIYPSAVTEAVKALQAQAVEAGITETKIGSPFWRITPAKED